MGSALSNIQKSIAESFDDKYQNMSDTDSDYDSDSDGSTGASLFLQGVEFKGKAENRKTAEMEDLHNRVAADIGLTETPYGKTNPPEYLYFVTNKRAFQDTAQEYNAPEFIEEVGLCLFDEPRLHHYVMHTHFGDRFFSKHEHLATGSDTIVHPNLVLIVLDYKHFAEDVVWNTESSNYPHLNRHIHTTKDLFAETPLVVDVKMGKVTMPPSDEIRKKMALALQNRWETIK